MNRKNIFRRPLAWLLFVLIAAAGAVYVYFNFGKANSLINIEISMDRPTALKRSAQLARDFHLGPEHFRQTASFSHDAGFQNFVELEAGGLDTLVKVIRNGYHPVYFWEVRQFESQNAREVTFWFTPSGKSYGFSEKIPESEKGAALPAEAALRLAEHEAAYRWEVDLTPYRLIEQSKEERVSGRVDHWFVYERSDATIGEGRYRLKLAVSGDKLTGVNYQVKLPEDFTRRYTEMRSANSTIQSVSTAVIALIYGVLGVGAGIFILLRRRWLLWKKALLWGISIAFASVFLLTLNQLPFLWEAYDTSTSEGNFLFRQLLGGLLGAVGFGSIIAVSAMAGEGLGRMAFPRHLQFWRVWSREAASSRQVLGQTVAGYLFAVVILALDVFFYVTTTSRLGWWSPAGTLSDPNILATYLPWFDSIAVSLQAGFWEEALFRAVPIAMVGYLTRNKKSRLWWLGLVIVLQTLVFGAAHANYPQQPSYARTLEMIVPFTIMGLIYFYYGLLPAIIAHFAVDVFWISLPLWVSSAPGIWVDRLLVVLLLLVPLWVVLYFRIRNKTFSEIPEALRNRGWQPEPAPVSAPEEENSPEPIQRRPLEKWMLPAGVAGVVLWLVFTPFQPDVEKLRVTRGQAIEFARQTLQERYPLNPDGWKVLTRISDEVDIRDIFVWQEGGETVYRPMTRQFLAPPYWEVRWVKTTGTVEERTEEFTVNILNGPSLLSVIHKIPESQAGANLTQQEAQLLVDSVLEAGFGLRRGELKEVLVTPKKLENRTNWEFIYADTVNYPLGEGQGRYKIDLDGREVTNAFPYVYVPEEWQRAYTDANSIRQVVRSAGQITVLALLGFGLVMAVFRWTRKRFNLGLFSRFALLFAVFALGEVVFGWENTVSSYYTMLPWGNFLVMVLISLSLSIVFLGLVNGMIIGASVGWVPVRKPLPRMNLLYAAGAGWLGIGILAFAESFSEKVLPFWPDFSPMNSSLPAAGFAFSEVGSILIYPALFMVVFLSMHVVSRSWTVRKIAASGIALLAGFAVSAVSFQGVGFWLLTGSLAAGALLLLYLFFFRFHLEWIPVSFGMVAISGVLRTMIVCPYPAVWPGGLLMIVISGLIIWFWYKQLLNSQPAIGRK